VLLDPTDLNFLFVRNPQWDKFRAATLSSPTASALVSDPPPPKEKVADALGFDPSGRFVSLGVPFDVERRVYDALAQRLLSDGAKMVRRAALLGGGAKAGGEAAQGGAAIGAAAQVNLIDMFDAYVKRNDVAVTAAAGGEENREMFVNLARGALVDAMRESGGSIFGLAHFLAASVSLNHSPPPLVKRVDSTPPPSSSAGASFRARLERVTIQNFLSVKGRVTFDFASMGGVLFLTGRNGVGKCVEGGGGLIFERSCVLEAIFWCLFDDFLRSDMRSDFAVNDEVNEWDFGEGC
jgi:hypothetical protein